MASPHGPTPGGWSFDAQRGTYYQYDAQKRQYVYADGLIVPQTSYSKPHIVAPAHRGYDQPMHTNYAPPPPPPPHYPPSLPTYYSDRQTYVNAAPPPPTPPPPPPPPRNFNPSTTSPQYHSSGSSYVPMPSRSLESGYAPRDPRYVQALPSLQYGQLAYQSHLAPPSPYIATGTYSNGGLGDDQNDRNRQGRNHFQDNNPPAGGGQPNGHDRIDDGDETQAPPRYYFPPDGG